MSQVPSARSHFVKLLQERVNTSGVKDCVHMFISRPDGSNLTRGEAAARDLLGFRTLNVYLNIEIKGLVVCTCEVQSFSALAAEKKIEQENGDAHF